MSKDKGEAPKPLPRSAEIEKPNNGFITAFAIRGIKALVKTVLTPKCYHGGPNKGAQGVHRAAFPIRLEGSWSECRVGLGLSDI